MCRSRIMCRIYSGEACRQEKRYFVPGVGFYALRSFSIPPPPSSAAASRPSCPPFTAQPHFFHFTSAIPSWHSKKSKHTHERLPSLALPCSFSSIYRRPEKGAAGAAAPSNPPLSPRWVSSVRGTADLRGLRTAGQTSWTFNWILVLRAVTESCDLVKKAGCKPAKMKNYWWHRYQTAWSEGCPKVYRRQSVQTTERWRNEDERMCSHIKSELLFGSNLPLVFDLDCQVLFHFKYLLASLAAFLCLCLKECVRSSPSYLEWHTPK